jgi:cysteinyl-tRNA synthetase
MPLRAYNTLTRQKEPFETVQPGKVGMYVCGPTVYKPSHIGHMVGPVIFDTIKRYLTYLGYQVTWIVNITDVDDKLIVRAKELGTTVKDLAEQMTADYLDALKKLNVTGIDHMPRATEHIPAMIEIMSGLIEKGYAYAAGGDVYFDITKDSDYGKLCNRNAEEMEAGARIEVSDKKRNPGDFALWKAAKPGEPQWDSPWGPGRPGWHIECSAMSMKLLGETLDIHGGGLDLQFPHHENELAQSESYTGRPFAQIWMHNGLLKMGQAKMAGSVGNVVNVGDLLQKHQPGTVRFLLLSTHYRSPIEYSDERLQELKRSVENFHRFFERYQRVTGETFYEIQMPWSRRIDFWGNWTVGSDWEEWVQLRQKFFECMDDDFNTAGAIGALNELLTALNRYVEKKQLEEFGERKRPVLDIFQKGTAVLRELTQTLGLFREPEKSHPESDKLLRSLRDLATELKTPVDATQNEVLDRVVEAFIEQRKTARKAKNYALADQIRQRLVQIGITLEDRPGGTGWRVDS